MLPFALIAWFLFVDGNIYYFLKTIVTGTYLVNSWINMHINHSLIVWRLLYLFISYCLEFAFGLCWCSNWWHKCTKQDMAPAGGRAPEERWRPELSQAQNETPISQIKKPPPEKDKLKD